MSLTDFKTHSQKDKIYVKFCKSNENNEDLSEINNIFDDFLEIEINNNFNSILSILQVLSSKINFITSFGMFSTKIILKLLKLMFLNNLEIQKISAECMMVILVNFPENGHILLKNNIINLLIEEMTRNYFSIYYYFPVLRILSSYNINILQEIPLHFIKILFHIHEMRIENGIFISNLSKAWRENCRKYDKSFPEGQTLILYLINELFRVNFIDSFKYLVLSLRTLSTVEIGDSKSIKENSSESSDNIFDLSTFFILKLDDLILLALENSKLHSIYLSNQFISNILDQLLYYDIDDHQVNLFLEKIICYILKNSINIKKSKCCESSLKLLAKLVSIKYGKEIIHTINDNHFEMKVMKIFLSSEICFLLKKAITDFLLTYSLQLSFEIFIQLFSFNFYQIIEFVFASQDKNLASKCIQMFNYFIPIFKSRGLLCYLIAQLSVFYILETPEEFSGDPNEYFLQSFLKDLNIIMSEES